MLTVSTLLSGVCAAEAPPVAKTMAIMPSQKDVEIETPKPAEFPKCKVDVERKGKTNGWMVIGPSGQILRKFLDTDGDGKLDQWRFYNHGIEVYRDIDSNHNDKIDQCRWLNREGSRWGIDHNEDGRIDTWKVISAAEASKEAVRAMTAGDDAALATLMITAEDLKLLGVNPQLTAKILESAADPGKKAKAIMAKSKSLSPHSHWDRFEARIPSTIPVDDEKANADLQVYESATAIVETQKDKFSAVQIGDMIRVGEVWKLTQVPRPIEGEGTMTNMSLMMEPMVASSSQANTPGPSPKVEKLLKDLQEIEQTVMKPGLTAPQVKALMVKRAGLMKEAFELAETDDEKSFLWKQNIDGYALTAQMGIYPDGVKDLKAIEADITKKSPKSPLVPYTTYRLMQAEYSVSLKEADEAEYKDKDKDKDKAKQEEQARIQKEWLQGLEDFVTKYPNSDDADDAMVTLGTHEELQGRTKEAITWYQRLITERPKSEVASRAQGALKRINLNGQILSLEGPLLAGGSLDIKKLKDKVVLVVFWASEYKVCEEDVPQLRAIYQEYKAKGLEIVGVSLDLDKSTTLPFIKKNSMTWPQIYQPSSQNQPGGLASPLAISFGIISLPTMFLVNKEGKVMNRNATIADVKSELPGLLK